MEPVYDCKSGEYNRQLPPFQKYKLISFNVPGATGFYIDIENIISIKYKKVFKIDINQAWFKTKKISIFALGV